MLLTSQNGEAGEDGHFEADVCVYGGTSSSDTAAEREGAKVNLIQTNRSETESRQIFDLERMGMSNCYGKFSAAG